MQCNFLSIDDAQHLDGGVAVVVDVMRAYTVAAWSLHLGASGLILVADVEEAVRVAAQRPGALLFKDADIDARFDLHNSPVQLLALDVADRIIVQRTSAGTQGAVAARRAEHLFCSGLVGATATAEAVMAIDPDEVSFVVTGSNGTADEDLACAEYIAELIRGADPDAGPFVDRAKASRHASRLLAAADGGWAGIDAGDVDMCVDVDRFDFAMRTELVDDLLMLRRVV
ncbi:MAG: 2-phosphosulfolactate phosphatase [Acidimicrobiales bacterium]